MYVELPLFNKQFDKGLKSFFEIVKNVHIYISTQMHFPAVYSQSYNYMDILTCLLAHPKTYLASVPTIRIPV